MPDDLLQSVHAGINPAYLHDVIYDDKLLGVPFCFYCEVLCWTLDYFAEVGLTRAPDTMDELIAYAQKLTKYDASGM